jgi:predicted Zn-dependent protease
VAGRVSWARQLLGASMAQAAPPIDEVLGPETVLPPRGTRVAFVAPAPLPSDREGLDPARLAQDPDMFGRFIEADPSRLDTASMEPAVALTLAQILLRGERTFLAEKLLFDASRRWPERSDLSRAHARVLISLGRPQAAVDVLGAAIERVPGDASLRYLLARALLGLPRNGVNEGAALVALEATLEIDPQYVDPEGVTAEEIRQVIGRLRAPAAAPVGPAQ